MPIEPNILLRMKENPSRQGVTTGRFKLAGTQEYIEIVFGPSDVGYKLRSLFEPVVLDEDIYSLARANRYAHPSELRRILTSEKIKGKLTDIYYSMGAGNNKFYPHQFKPVLRFIESPVGRLLIADEVGLGKTIEAVYIWKELQARQQARRLLVICPAVLQEKWRRDLAARFGIDAEIAQTRRLLDRLRQVVKAPDNHSFAMIASLEGLRPPSSFEDLQDTTVRAQLARLLDEHPASDDFSLIDLAIIDEAHYLRNPSTASNKLGKLIRDSAGHMVLLTATPVQIHSENLFQLLKIINQDQFNDPQVFYSMLEANRPLVEAQRLLWKVPFNIDEARTLISKALSSEYFRGDEGILRIKTKLENANDIERSERIDIYRTLDSRSLLSQYVTRSRKREVLEKRVERRAQSLSVKLHPYERKIYNQLTMTIRARAKGLRGATLFSLISRQRQMASSIVAALESWTEKNIVDDLLWEDLGSIAYQNDLFAELDKDFFPDKSIRGDDTGADIQLDGVQIEELERIDSKYNKLLEFIGSTLEKSRKEKIVIFAYYRNTLKYLGRRLAADGISAVTIMGGMGDECRAILDDFARPDGPDILLSSEVGSEGIDLQFCRYLVNYDLPWNPMRVEQRIGRLDRLGQESDYISIVNFALADTIEDRILMRLYERIRIFEESIGDLEDILGEVTERLLLDFFNAELSDEERLRRVEQGALAVENGRQEQERLEKEAVNLVGFSDYILSNITQSHDSGRMVTGEELLNYLTDFFDAKYPGATLAVGPGRRFVSLSLPENAQNDLLHFITTSRPTGSTRLHNSARAVKCYLGMDQGGGSERFAELLEPAHPLIQWIRTSFNDKSDVHPLCAIKLGSEATKAMIGEYGFMIHLWTMAGMRTENRMVFCAQRFSDNVLLEGFEAECLVFDAARRGDVLYSVNDTSRLDSVLSSIQSCEERLMERHIHSCELFVEENHRKCNMQLISANSYASRRLDELHGRIDKFKQENKLKSIPMTNGLIKRVRQDLDLKVRRIKEKQSVDTGFSILAAGYVRVVQ